MIKPFVFWCQKIVPLVYDDSLSYYEVLCKVVSKLNEIITSENNSSEAIQDIYNKLNDLKNYIDNFLNSENFNEIVENILNAWVENNKLYSILNGYPQSFNTVDMHRLGRFYQVKPENINGGTIPNPYYSIMQGGCYLTNRYAVYCKVDSVNYLNSASFKIFNIDSLQVTQEFVVDNVGHCNWLSYDGQSKLYATSLYYYDNEGQSAVTYGNKVSVINMSNNLKESEFIIQSDLQLWAYSIDSKTGKHYGMFLPKTVDRTSNLIICEIDPVSHDILNSVVLKTPEWFFDKETMLSAGNAQGGSVYDGIVYWVSYYPPSILSFDVNTGNLVECYNVERYADTKYFIGEIENISPITDSKNLDWLAMSFSNDCYNGQLRFDNILTFNPVRGIPCTYALPTYATRYARYVDPDTTAINPDGSEQFPFKSIGEAIQSNNNALYDNLNIILKNGEHYFTYISSPKIITISAESALGAQINGVATNGGTVTLTDVVLNSNNPKYPSDLTNYNCDCNLNYVKFLSAKEINLTHYGKRLAFTDIQWAEGSIAKLNNMVIENLTQGTRSFMDITDDSNNFSTINPIRLYTGDLTWGAMPLTAYDWNYINVLNNLIFICEVNDRPFIYTVPIDKIENNVPITYARITTTPGVLICDLNAQYDNVGKTITINYNQKAYYVNNTTGFQFDKLTKATTDKNYIHILAIEIN